MRKNISLLILFLFSCVHAEEGMWPFNMIPTEQIKDKYGVTLDHKWAEHIQRSCLRISLGGSGSFISERGLFMTNHHVGTQAVYNLSSKDNDLMSKGFYARTLEQELKCPNMYVDELVLIRDVTTDVNQALKLEMSAAEKETARKKAIAGLKIKAQEETGLQPEMVTLYQGARYHLYLYKRYTDVRLVMAPEKSIAFLGGDADNFEYPRYNLDVCFFRVYENNKPLHVENYLKWSKAGPQAVEPLFVAGHPGRTQRMYTSSHLKFLKDQELPLYLQWIKEKRKALLTYAGENSENARISLQQLFGLENSYKVLYGIYTGLTTNPIIEKKQKYEKELYGNPEDFAPWVKLKTALEKAKAYYPAYQVLEGGGSYYSKLYVWARHLVRLATERTKPNDIRLKEYADTELPTLELNLFSSEPVYMSLEKVNLVTSLKRLIQVLGKNHPAVVIALNGKTPEERADELLDHTRLANLDDRKQLYNHPEEIKTTKDPLILLAIALDPSAREMRKRYEDELDSVQKESYAEIAKVIFDRYGESVYPDATFTLRLSTGTMKGYKQNETFIEPFTTIGGVYTHAKLHDFKGAYALPTTWTTKEKGLNKATPFNFVSTNDIIGGNSGSPVVNAKGELVGIIFDGNIQSLTWDYEFDETQGRAVSVHSQGILEALKHVYGANSLVQEIMSK